MRLLLSCLLLVLTLTGCGTDYERLAKQRQQYALENRGDIVIVAIEESWTKSYLEGIRLAVEEINARPGKLLGRSLRLEVKPGSDDYDEVHDTILEVINDPTVTAVMGHRRTEIAISASVLYEASQVLFINPLSTGSDLTTHGFEYTFRMAPNNATMAEQSASVARQLGYKNIALFYSEGFSRRELAFLFEEAAIDRGLHFVSRRSIDAEDPDYRDLISQFSSQPVDMVFLSTDTKPGARMIRQLREMGVTAPVMGGSPLNLNPLGEAAGEAANHTIVPIFYDSDNESAFNKRFVAAYRQRHDDPPDQFAAQGYDSVHLLAAAVERAKSTLPPLLATTLHYLPYWQGATGVHSFNMRGDPIGKKYFFQALRDNKWHTLPGVHQHYFVGKFDRSLRTAEPGVEPSQFGVSFTKKMDAVRLRTVQLDFLYRILHFGKLGLIYGDSGSGEEPEKIHMTRNLARKRGFRVETCAVPLARSDAAELENRLLGCFGRLSIDADAINLTDFGEADRDVLLRMQKTLTRYEIPLLSLEGDVDFGEGTTIRVGRFGQRTNIQSDYYINLFGGLLNGIKVYELAERMENLPALAVNFPMLDRYGLLRSSPLLGLAPDLYLEWTAPEY